MACYCIGFFTHLNMYLCYIYTQQMHCRFEKILLVNSEIVNHKKVYLSKVISYFSKFHCDV